MSSFSSYIYLILSRRTGDSITVLQFMVKTNHRLGGKVGGAIQYILHYLIKTDCKASPSSVLNVLQVKS